MACLLDVTTPKPGNVHRGADFADMTFLDFAASAVAIGPVFERAACLSVGELVKDAIVATRSVVSVNTNLGIVLLFAPLAKTFAADAGRPVTVEAVDAVLQAMTPADSNLVYEAIRLATPGGLGEVKEGDIRDKAPDCLLAAMRLASDRDAVAEQYATGFRDLIEKWVPQAGAGVSEYGTVSGILDTFVRIMAEKPDSLIRRKCGDDVAQQASEKAKQVVQSGLTPGAEDYHVLLSDLDFWLRADGHRRNPGTSADLVSAAVFVALLEGRFCRF